MEIQEKEIYDKLIKRLDKIKNNIEEIKDISSQYDNGKSNNYIKKLNKLSYKMNNLKLLSEKIKHLYLTNTPNEYLNLKQQKEIKDYLISKKIHDMFNPYMLYMLINLQNNQ